MSNSYSDIKSKIIGFCILFLPTTVMISFIVWAVTTSILGNKITIWELSPTMCLVKANAGSFTNWLNNEDVIHSNLVSVSGSSKLFIQLTKTLNQTCDDVW